MHPSSILLALASAALIRAIAIPQPAPPSTYDTCIDQYAQIFEQEIADGAAPAGIAQCTSCAGQAVGKGFEAYVDGDVAAAKQTYTESMNECRGETTDAQYNTCINEFGTIFEFAPTPGIATCTGCAGEAVGSAFLAYVAAGAGEDGVEAAKVEYEESMEDCRTAEA